MKWNLELPYDAIQDYTRIKILLDADLLELTTEVRYSINDNYKVKH